MYTSKSPRKCDYMRCLDSGGGEKHAILTDIFGAERRHVLQVAGTKDGITANGNKFKLSTGKGGSSQQRRRRLVEWVEWVCKRPDGLEACAHGREYASRWFAHGWLLQTPAGFREDALIRFRHFPADRTVANPPSTPQTCPVTQSFSGSSNQAIAEAMC
jgi:hypothetical protein